jgi:hypothetical protein
MLIVNKSNRDQKKLSPLAWNYPFKTKVRAIYPSVFNKPEVRNELERLHEEFVLLPADKACNNSVSLLQLYLK